jgi:hypothetical protein
MPFDEELAVLLKSGLPFEELQEAVVKLHHKHSREVPPPVTGTMELAEPEDSFGN